MFGNMNPMELIVVVGVAVLLFGRRLPEVGRTLGKGIVEFKKGIRGLEEEFRFDEKPANPYHHEPPPFVPSDLADSAVPKFQPPTAAPTLQPERAVEPTQIG